MIPAQPYRLPNLPFAYDALEPYIDAKTMQVHLNGHHKTYVDKLNKTMEKYPNLQRKVEDLLSSLETLPSEVRTSVTNNGGGHANHTLFWSILTPQKGSKPSSEMVSLFNATYGSFSTFQEKFAELATSHFSNGWAWLCVDTSGKLQLLTTKDHESPITLGLVPLLTLDLWEHAYYLSYQNKRADFVHAFWNILNWDEIGWRWNEFQRDGRTSREWRLAS